MLLFNTVICDSRAMLVSHSMDTMPIAMENPWKVARWPNKCRWRYSRALHAGFRLVFRKKRHWRAQRRRVTTSPKIPLVNTNIPTVPITVAGPGSGWTLNRAVANLHTRKYSTCSIMEI